jgi:sugar-specific transcriptional regulator TrmB
MSHVQQLEALGWNKKEACIYVALLKLGIANVNEIAVQAKLKRTTIYNFLPNLLQRGAIKKTQKNRKTLFYVDDTAELLTPVEQEKKRWEKLVKSLEVIHKILPDRPKIRFFEGESGAIQFFQETLNHTPPGQSIREFIGPQAFYEKLPSHYSSSYVPERIKRKIPIRIIASRSPAAEALAKNAKSELRHIKLVQNSIYDGAIVIFGNHIGLLSLSTHFMGVMIENEAIANIQKSAFELLWNHLP